MPKNPYSSKSAARPDWPILAALAVCGLILLMAWLVLR